MKITEKEVRLFLDDDGQAVMGLASVDLQAPVYVRDADDIGMWIRIHREDGEHFVLVRWDYVLSLDFRDREKRPDFKPSAELVRQSEVG